MKHKYIVFGLIFGFFGIGGRQIFGEEGSRKPVTPKASAEAKALLEFMYSISGMHKQKGFTLIEL